MSPKSKLRTKSSAKKRFWRTGTGKIKYKPCGLRHLLTGMSGNRGRRLRKTAILLGKEAKIIDRII
jgi:large subunit ribosomal protein L35